jgi:ATP-dependent RNA helicase DDX35
LPYTPSLLIAQHGAGDILMFLTGREEIERCLEELTELLPTCAFCFLVYFFILMQSLMLSRLPRGATQIIPLALHAGLSTEEQLRVFNVAERGTRKVIAATNIAEVSRAIFSNLVSYAIRPASPSMECSLLSTVGS